MELDQFKDVYLVIDKANDIFIPRQFVSQGDYKGRTLTVQITNNGSIGEVPGLTLNLNWHNEASGLTDLTAFTILDKANSIFRIEYPKNMMTPGKVYASIQIIQDGKVTNLKQFELIVQELAGQPVGIAENADFSALVAVLADSNKFRTDIDSLSANKADKTALSQTNILLTNGLNSKVDKGGGGQITLPMLSTDVKTAMTGGSVAVVGKNAVLTENIVDKQITPEKTNFLKIGKNKFNYKTATAGYYIDPANGALLAGTKFAASDFIPVSPNTSYKQSVSGRSMGFYDPEYKFISALVNTTTSTFTTPSNAAYVRITIMIPYEINTPEVTIDKYMVVLETDSLDYEPYYMELAEKNDKKVSSSDIAPGAITKEQLATGSVTPYALEGLEVEGNLIHSANVIHGKYAHAAKGVFEILDNPTYDYFIIRVKPNTKYSFTSGRFVVELLENQSKVTQYLENVTSITTTSEAVYVSVSFNKDVYPVESFMIVEGDMPEGYIDNVLYKVPWLYTGEHEAEETITINLPDKLYATVGTEFNVFTKNVLKYNDQEYNIKYSCTIGKQMQGKFTVTPTTSGKFPLTLEIYKKSKVVANKTVSIIVSEPRTAPIKVMVLGDSTVRAGYMTQRLVDKMGNNVHLVGVMGDSPNHFEGRGGWTAAYYRTDSKYLDLVNPFYNPETNDFDFSYYMGEQGITGLQVVIINLGINDTFGFTTDPALSTGMTKIISDLDFISASIKAYDPNIKVSFNITIPPNDNQDIFGESYGTGQTQWRYKYNNHIWVAKMIEYYQGKNDLINIHSSVDVVNNINDGVHPTVDGYNQIGDTVYSYLNNLI